MLRALAKRGHHLTLATLWENPAEQKTLQCLAAETQVSVISFPLGKAHSTLGFGRALLNGAPLQSQFSWHPRLAQALRSALSAQTFDAIHAEHLRGSPYGLLLKEELSRRGMTTPVVYDSVDSISLLYGKALQSTRSKLWKQIIRFELPRTRRYEGRLVRTFDRVLVTSVSDRAALIELAAGLQPGHRSGPKRQEIESKIFVLPNGVDLEYFCPGQEPRQPDQIVFSGKMSYHANESAALFLVNEVMPCVWAKRPNVQVILAGKSPPSSIRNLAAGHPNVQATGDVPDLRPYLRQASVAVAPLTYGAGIQNKVLEAMACGTPVVATPLAISALSAIPNQDVLVAEKAADLAEAILCLLENQPLRERIGKNGRNYVEISHNWDTIAKGAEIIYRSGRM